MRPGDDSRSDGESAQRKSCGARGLSPLPRARGGARKRWKGVPGKLALLFGSTVAALLLGEAMARLFFPGDSPLSVDIYRLDAHGLLGLKPGVTRRHAASDWDVAYAINREGLRDRQLPLDDTGGTVLALGDSFAFGWGVDFPRTFLYRAEEALRPVHVRIVKAGIPGTGTGDQRRWLDVYGERYRPDMVLLCFFVGNDFVDVQLGGVASQFTVENGLVVRRLLGPHRAPLTDMLLDRINRSSLLAQRASLAIWAWKRRHRSTEPPAYAGLEARDPWLFEFVKIHLKEVPPETARGIRETEAELDAIRDWCRAHGAALALVVIPRSFQVYGWELEKWRRAFSVATDDLDCDRPQRILADWCGARGVARLDLLPPFRADAARRGDRLFFYPNGHMNGHGHDVAAASLAPFLLELMNR